MRNLKVGDRVNLNPGRDSGDSGRAPSGDRVDDAAFTLQEYFGFGEGSSEILDDYPEGGLCEYQKAPADDVVIRPAEVSFEEACRFGYLGTGYSALRKAGVGPSTTDGTSSGPQRIRPPPGGDPAATLRSVVPALGETVGRSHRPRMHQTPTVHYAVALSGSVELDLGGGQRAALQPGGTALPVPGFRGGGKESPQRSRRVEPWPGSAAQCRERMRRIVPHPHHEGRPMKLLSYRHNDRESFGALVGDGVADLAELSGVATLADFVGSDAFEKREQLLEGAAVVPLSDLELLPVIPRPEKIICSVRNYMDHHQEALAAGLNRELSDFPPIFLRVWRSQVAHDAPIIRPSASETLDWEGELAVVIGKGGRDIPVDDAWGHVAGYSVYNDASVREFQFHAKQIAAGKNFESTGGFGPYLVTHDEIEPGEALSVETRINGETVQSGDTSQMIFSVPQLINYASTIFTLTPGDVIATGTPSGVGFSRKPPRYLVPGDVVEVEIAKVGLLRNPVRDQA